MRASIDDFHHPRAHRHALGRTGETVWTRSFDYRALRHHLLDPWCAGAGAAYRRRHHDLAADAFVDEPAAEVPEHGVLVVDGVFAQRDELAALLGPRGLARGRRRGAGTPDGRARRRPCRSPRIPTSARYLDAQRLYRAVADPLGAPTSSSTTPTPRGRSWWARRPCPPGWHRTPHGLRRVVTTDAETAARINRLLGE